MSPLFLAVSSAARTPLMTRRRARPTRPSFPLSRARCASFRRAPKSRSRSCRRPRAPTRWSSTCFARSRPASASRPSCSMATTPRSTTRPGSWSGDLQASRRRHSREPARRPTARENLARMVTLEILSGRIHAADFVTAADDYFAMTAMWPAFAQPRTASRETQAAGGGGRGRVPQPRLEVVAQMFGRDVGRVRRRDRRSIPSSRRCRLYRFHKETKMRPL